MRIVFAGNESRGLPCLKRIVEDGHTVVCVISTPSQSEKFVVESKALGLRVEQCENVNHPEFVSFLRSLNADVTVLAGFSQIVKQSFIGATKQGAINLHAGKLPEMRGSSPLNWALIHGKDSATFSVIGVDTGVDTGPVLDEKTVPITPSTTIADLHAAANESFPALVGNVLQQMARGDLKPRWQSEDNACYYPLRFAEDGLIVWDLMAQERVVNMVRALKKPYPGAFGIIHGRKLSLQATIIPKTRFSGEPGRIYRIDQTGILVGTATDAIWISEAFFEGEPALDFRTDLKRYDSFLTVRQVMLQSLTKR